MDSDQQFWVTVWRTVAMAIVGVFVTGAVSCQVTNYQIRKAIADGADPFEARCAFDSNADSRCLLVLKD